MSVTHLKNLLNEPVLDLQRLHCSIAKFLKYTKLTRQLLKVLVKVWSEDEDSRRILALLGLLKLVQCSPSNIAICMKSMFISYVRNSKFVMGSTLAHINFMRHSLIELYSLNLDEAYMHAFVYIRQLAIVLRKAYLQHSPDNSKAVQNWQFINSLRLWCDLVARYADSHHLLSSLLHPLVQILVGTIKLNPGERWIPLRFHCVSMLHTLAGVPTLTTDQSKEAGDNSQSASFQSTKLIGRSRPCLVPSLPLLLDVFQLVNFNKHSLTPSAAPLDLRLLLHFSPSQRRETASMDAIVSWLVDLLTESAALGAASVAFPEFAMPLISQLKQLSRTCRVAAFTRQTKALQVKLREHSDWVASQRRRLRSLANPDDIALLESQLASYAAASSEEKASTSPFWSFYTRHKEVRANELAQLTLSHQKDSSRHATITEKPDHQRASKKHIRTEDSGDSDEASDESDSSDGSYDYDDGVNVTHVSRRHKSKQGQAVANDPASGSDSDFDLEAALKENIEERSDEEGATTAADEVTDFEMSDSDPDLDPPQPDGKVDAVEVEESESPGTGASKAFKAKKTKAGKRGGGKAAHQTRKRARPRGGAGSKFTNKNKSKKKAVSHGRGGRGGRR